MRYFDMHCDTLSRCADNRASVLNNDFDISLEKLSQFDRAVQFFAAFIETEKYQGKAAYDRFLQQYEVFCSALGEAKQFSNVTPILTVENLACINGDLSNIAYLKQCGVRVASLTWNGYNGIAGGVGAEEGISDFGREAVRELERQGITIDVSHLNDKSFFELCDIASKPFIATHSNTRAYCPHPRNLTADQLAQIFRSGGIVGLNLYTLFLGERQTGYGDLLRHIDNMYRAGGEGRVALGTDFDGCDTDERFRSVSDMPAFYDALTRELSENEAESIFYGNAAQFFKDLT